MNQRLLNCSIFCLMSLYIAACGGGSGGGGDGNAPPPSGPPQAVEDGIWLEAESLATSGAPWNGRIWSYSGSDLSDIMLLSAPLGMSLDAATGTLTWTPAATDAGAHAIRVSAVVDDEIHELESALVVVGRTLVAEEQVGAAGATIGVHVPNSRLYGAQIEFPAGALQVIQSIRVSEVSMGPLLPPGSIVMDCEPSQSFGAPVTLSIPYDSAQLAGLGSDAADLRVHLWDEVLGWQALPGGFVDTQNQVVVGQTTHLSRFALIDAASSMFVPAQLTPVLRALGLAEPGQNENGVSAISVGNATSRLHQPRRIRVLHGDGVCLPEEKTALIVHGILSNSSEFTGPADLVQSLAGTYDNILGYDYPSGQPISSNGWALARMIANDESMFMSGAILDIYAHSMGGLVSRVLMENPAASGVLYGRVAIANLTTLATPHRGSDLFVPDWISNSGTAGWLLESLNQIIGTSGARDLIPTSDFILALNQEPYAPWTKYHCVGGVGGSGWLNSLFGEQHDNAVPISSALPQGLFPIAWQTTVVQDHNEVHTLFAAASGPAVLAQVRPKRFYDDGITVLNFQRTVSWSDGPDFDVLQASATVHFAEDLMLLPGSTVFVGLGVSCAEPAEEQLACDFILNMPFPWPIDRNVNWFVVPDPISGEVRSFSTLNASPTQYLSICNDVLDGVTIRNTLQVRLPGDSVDAPWRDFTLP